MKTRPQESFVLNKFFSHTLRPAGWPAFRSLLLLLLLLNSRGQSGACGVEGGWRDGWMARAAARGTLSNLLKTICDPENCKQTQQ